MSTLAPYPQEWPKAVIFDWDNTLVDTWLVCYEAFNRTLKKFTNASCTPQDFYDQPRYSVRDFFPETFGSVAAEAEMFFYTQVEKSHLKSLRPLPGAEKLLQVLCGKDIHVGIVSNKEGRLLRCEVRHLGWEHYFHSVVGSRDTLEDKPSPLPLIEALKGTHVAPGHSVWFVGDSSVDMLCAKNTGCVPIAVEKDAVLSDTPTVYVSGCLGVLKLLMGL